MMDANDLIKAADFLEDDESWGDIAGKDGDERPTQWAWEYTKTSGYHTEEYGFDGAEIIDAKLLGVIIDPEQEHGRRFAISRDALIAFLGADYVARVEANHLEKVSGD